MRRRLLLTILALCALGAAAPAAGEPVQKGNLRVSFSGAIAPKRLPRHGAAPISVRLGGRIATTDGSDPPALKKIEIAINREGRLDPRAVPTCDIDKIQPSSTTYARQVCGAARVGDGSFSASIAIPEQSPFPSRGTVTAFNGTENGRPVVLLHIYGAKPFPTSFTLPLRISRGRGRFGTVLSGRLPTVDVHVGFVTGISLRLDGTGGRRSRPYLSAGCPAPPGFTQIPFPLARAGFSFAGGKNLSSTLERTCLAQG